MRRKLPQTLAKLRRYNRAWSKRDAALLLACVRNADDAHRRIKAAIDADRPEGARDVAQYEGNLLLARQICAAYGMSFAPPGFAIAVPGGEPIELPVLKTIAYTEGA